MSGNDIQRQIKGARISRALLAVPAAIFTVLFMIHLASGALFLGVLNAFTAALFVVSVVLTTARIRIMRRTLARAGTSPAPGLVPPASAPLSSLSVREKALRRIAHRPRRVMTPGDYRRLRELEAELGWEPSEPLMPVKLPAQAARRSGGEYAVESAGGTLHGSLCDCGDGYRRSEIRVPESAAPVASYCTCCGRRTDDDVAHVLNPDTTAAATAGQYARWLRGYVKNGGKITHWYDYPFARAGFRYAASTVTVDSDYEYGARGRSIIVARDAPVKRTRPTAAFGGWAHTRCYWMHGYRTSEPRIVAAYSDPEFDEFRHEGDAPGSLPAKVAWDDVAYASEASQHFAQLARVGRKYCPSYCPICAARLDALMRASILAPKPDLGGEHGDMVRDMRDLQDLDTTRVRPRPFVTSDLAPAGANSFHLDGAGREWCRDGDGLLWLKFAPDGPWHRQDKPEGGE